MKSTVKKLDKSQVEITIEVSTLEMQPYLQRTAERLAKEMKIEGFRPGKAPYEIIKQKVGDMGLLQESIDDVISATYYEVLKTEKIVTIGQPSIDVEKVAPDNDFVYRATASVLPNVKIGDWKKLKVKSEEVKITNEQVDKIIEDIRKMQATEKLVEREAKTGDKVEVNFEVFLDKVPIEKGKQDKYPVVIGENKFIPGFEEKIIGMKAGAEKEFELKFPEKYFDKKMAGKTAEFKVKCNSVFEIELPELNDAFASSVSADKFKTVAEVKKNVLENLKAEEGGKQEQKVEIEMLDKLVDISEFEAIPDLLIDNEVHKMVHELEHSISNQGFNFADYLKSLNKTEEDLKTEFRPQAEKRVKISILAREIYVQEKFEVRDDEIEAEIEVVMQNYPNNEDVRKQLETETYKDYLKNTIGNRKVIEFLKKEIIVK
ncbi:trigger factor [Candidatus Falkowbacteria bacterium]|uniref:Trigger factor n=1 Tax=Candidatus Buchananbacteria bacterium CG10_big_fil_rev_8_21_14_0_10_33_19 TaxID=1974525 RepID=A0A2H0W4U4_9BACT|nr:trigger factor [Candidatus Falkowbacteria bacterium]PIS06369.1 MAG: trigger factor [Candidatus Buchananbacteria bacterium CG10_big_fil_rev_8_21_14_0_10_33_19]